MSRVMTRIQPLNPELVADPSWEVIGIHPNGKALYKESQPRSRAVPLTNPETGEREWLRHGVTGEKLVAKNRPELYTKVRIFYLESTGQGHVTKVDYTPPSQAELDAAQRRLKIAAAKDALAEAFVDSGLTAEQIVERLRAPVAAPAATVAYPLPTSAGRWKLSDGSSFAGKKADALMAEAALSEAAAGLADAAADAVADAEAAARAAAAADAEATPSY